MLVYQCDSCQTHAAHEYTPGNIPRRPKNWSKLTLQLPQHSSPRNYDLCDECTKKPIQFGDIAFYHRSRLSQETS